MHGAYIMKLGQSSQHNSVTIVLLLYDLLVGNPSCFEIIMIIMCEIVDYQHLDNVIIYSVMWPTKHNPTPIIICSGPPHAAPCSHQSM